MESKPTLNILLNGFEEIANIDGYDFFNEGVKQMLLGSATYLTQNSYYYNLCDINDYQQGEYYFFFPTHSLSYNDLLNYLEKNVLLFNLITNYLNSNNVKVIFIDLHESHEKTEFIKFVNLFKNKNVNLDNLFIINNDSNLKEYTKELDFNISVHKSEHLVVTSSGGFSKTPISFILDKPKFFLCLNNRAKAHRLGIVSWLKHFGMLEDSNISYLSTNYYEEANIFFYLGTYLYKKLKNDIEYIHNNHPILTDSEKIHNPDIVNNLHIVFAGLVDVRDYMNSYVNIVTESVFFSERIHITEKSVKPFAFFQIPIFVASQNHVKTLREKYGFDMFDDIVNHEYDNEPNEQIRLQLVLNEIKRIYDNKTNIIQFYKDNKERFVNNRKLIYELSKKTFDFDYFDKIKWK